MKTLQTLKPVTTTLLVALIAFTVACGYSSKAMPAVAGAMPTIAALDPTSANAGGAAFTLTVNGTNFGSKAVVNLNGAAQTSNTMFVSASQLTVVVPASAIATAGSVTVTVTNPGTPGGGLYGGGGTLPETSSPTTFTVN
jgi:hypothetical protein